MFEYNYSVYKFATVELRTLMKQHLCGATIETVAATSYSMDIGSRHRSPTLTIYKVPLWRHFN